MVWAQLADPGTTLAVATSLSGAGVLALTEDERQTLIRLVEAIDRFLVSLADPDGQVRTEGLSAIPWRRVVQMPEDKDCFEIDVRLHMSRALDKVDHRVVEHGLTEVWEVAALIPPGVELTGDAPGLRRFGEGFEQAFAGHKLAVGLGKSSARALWAIRRELVTLQIDPARAWQPSCFALPPLATELLSDEVEIRVLGGGDPLSLRVTDIDLDLLARSFLRDVEAFLEPEMAVAARRIDGNSFNRIVSHKDRLAEGLSARLKVVFDDPALSPDADRVGNVFGVLRDRLAADLRDCYDVDCAVFVPLLAPRTVSGARAFGRLITERGDGLRLTPANLERGKGEPGLIFLFDSLRETERSSVLLDDLRYRLTHVERPIEEGAPAHGANPWLQLLLPDDLELALPAMNLPVPLREYPQPPTLRAHGLDRFPVLPAGTFSERIHAARRWSYRVDFDHLDVDQDTVFAEVLYNQPEPTGRAGLAGGELHSRLVALAGYGFYREALWQTLRALAVGQASEEDGRQALADFEQLVSDVAASFASAGGFGGRILAGDRERYRIDDDPVDNGLRRLTVCQEIGAFEGQGSFEIRPLGEDGGELPTEPAPAPAGCAAVTYVPPPVAEGVLARLGRRLVRQDLDLLRVENAWAGCELWRNLELVPGVPSSDDFVYRTPAVRFGEPFTPWIDIKERIDVAAPDAPAAALADRVEHVLRTVLGEDVRERTIEIRWGYESTVLGSAIGNKDRLVRAPHPIGLMPAFVLDGQAGAGRFSFTEAAKAAAELLQGWYSEYRPARDSNGRPLGIYVGDLRLFGREEVSNRPLLRLRRLVIPLASLNDLPV
jgi:hypothetical protein